ncbi:MAG: MFS transporter [Anaerolineales bacterium]|nr:MFS transporter [Anaerolineales bacterium]
MAQSFFSASSIAAFTLSGIISIQLSGTDSTAGWPNTIGLIGRALFAYPLGYMMDRFGRRPALSAGYGTAIFGSIVSIWAIINANYLAFMLGAFLIGMARAAGEQSRYVGAEIFPLSRRAKVIGIIVSAGTIGAILGPQLVPISTGWMESIGLPPSTGPFVISGIFILYAALAIFLFLRPDPKILGAEVARIEAAEDPDSIENVPGGERPLRQIFAAPMVQLAIITMTLSFFVMTFVMVITPVHMNYHAHSTGAISNVIMAHTLGMFGLSWLSGWLIDRFGRIPMILSGAAILISACILAPLSLLVPILGLALFLLGLGWNFCFVSGSSLLSDALATHERGRAQGASETIVALGSGLASFSVGIVFQQGDYLLVSFVGLAFSLLLVGATLWLVRKDRKVRISM